MKRNLDMVIDSSIIAGIALFSQSGDLISPLFWLVGSKAFAIAFIVQFAVERGLRHNDTV